MFGLTALEFYLFLFVFGGWLQDGIPYLKKKKEKNEKQDLTSTLCEPPVEVLVSCDDLLTPYLFPAGSLMFPIIFPL